MNWNYTHYCLAITSITLGLFSPNEAMADAIGLSLSQSSLALGPGETVIVDGAITNDTGGPLDAAADLFFNFYSFDPALLTPVQLVGITDFTLTNGATSLAVDLFSLTASPTLLKGESSPITVALEDVNGDLSAAYPVVVTVEGEAATVPENSSFALLLAAVLLFALSEWRGRTNAVPGKRALTLAAGFSCLLFGWSPPATAQAPALFTEALSTDSSGGMLYIIVPIGVSQASASDVELTSASLTAAGIPASALLRPNPLPFSIGTLTPGSLPLLDLAFDNSALVSGRPYLLTLRGTYSFQGTMLGFALNRPFVYQAASRFGGPGNPVNVLPALDTSRAVSEFMFSPIGGTLTTSGADGTVFTLTVPPGALLDDEVISMTPVSALTGVPLSGGLLAAVDLQPAGLQFLQPAALTIQLPTPVPVTDQTGFTYGEGGQNFSLAPLANTSTITLNLLHFSGYGAASGVPIQPIAPSPGPAQLENAIADILREQRICEITGSDCDAQAENKLEEDFQLYYEEVVAPQLQQALTNYTVASSAIGSALNWLRQVILSQPAEGGLKEPFAMDEGHILETIPLILTN
ncbi:MAG: hypothetical protein WBW33_14405, partial [Bryobacteraceae bacterium]